MRRRKGAARTPHPDGEIELKLQRIIGLRAAIARQETLITDYRMQMNSARTQQNDASDALAEYPKQREAFETSMAAQAERIKVAQAGIDAAEQAIAARYEDIGKLAGELSTEDLSYL